MATTHQHASLNLLSLPLELRLKIYGYVFESSQQVVLIDHRDFHSSCHCQTGRSFDDVESNRFWIFTRTTPARKTRISYRSNPAQDKQSLNLYVHSKQVPDLALLQVNRWIHREAAEVAYGRIDFNFERSLPAVVPFMESISPAARRSIKTMRLAPNPPTKIRCWDEQSTWKETCSYIAGNLKLKTLHVRFTYLAGQNWSAQEWQRVLAVDESGNLANDTARAVLEPTSGSALTYVTSLDERSGMPRCRDFLETLPMESPAEEGRLVKTDPFDGRPVDPTLRQLALVNGLRSVFWSFTGGLSTGMKAEMQKFMDARMIAYPNRPSRPLDVPSAAIRPVPC